MAELVEACLREARGAAVRRIRIRHASTASEDVIRQAFSMLTADGPLAGAELATEPMPILLACACGFAGPLGPDEHAGPGSVVCPACAAIHVPPRQPEIELLELDLG